jgi:acetolactate synthase-1/2/3 large subunit
LDQELPVADAVVRALAEGGIRYVLGIPGGLTGPLWRAMHGHPTIRAIQCREESVASLMAEAYGRFTRTPVAVMGQGEWIVGNAGQGYLEALLGSSPLVVLTEMSDGGALSHHAPYQAGTGDYGTWDARTALTGVCKRVMVSHYPAQAVQHTQLAIKHAGTGEPGPVAVVFSGASLTGTVGPSTVPRIFPTGAYLPARTNAFDAGAVREAAAALSSAVRPVIIAGNGVRLAGARSALSRLSELLDAPVATTASGKGVFAETDPRAVGVMGPFGWGSANEVIGESDVVVAVGTKLGPTDTLDEHTAILDPARQTMIQIDVEPLNLAWTYPVDLPLAGDAAVVLEALCDTYGQLEGKARPETASARASAALARHDQFAKGTTAGDSLPLLPERTISVLEEMFPHDGVVTCDAGENRLFMMRWFRSQEGGEYLQPAAGGGMGYAVPAAMAAKLADPSRTVLAVCGDGGFAMSVHALMTAVQEGFPIGVLVLNNNALGWVLHSMGDKAVAANFASFDHAAIARSIGCEGVRISGVAELRDALKRVADATVPVVIDVPTSLQTSFRDVMHKP